MTPSFTLHTGDARDVLAGLPDASAQVCVTSPPYFRVRDYGVDGQLGREATPAAYVAALVPVLDELRRVLRPDGVLWLNLGDTYAGSRTGGRTNSGFRRGTLMGIPWRVALRLIDDGDWLLRCPVIWWKKNGLPEPATDRPSLSHEDVFMLVQNEDYYYDADAIRDEYAESTLREMRREYAGRNRKPYPAGVQVPGEVKARIVSKMRANGVTGGPNARSVWPLPTQPSDIPHYALMPVDLAERCILASSRPAGKKCDCEEVIKTPTGKGGHDDHYLTRGGGGLRRDRSRDGKPRLITRRTQRHHARLLRDAPTDDRRSMLLDAGSAWEHYIRTDRAGARPIPPELLARWIRAGWMPTDPAPPCTCPVEPADVVIDPFAGAGTTGVAALRTGRNFVGVELNPEYVDIARRRLVDVAPMFVQEDTHAHHRPQQAAGRAEPRGLPDGALASRLPLLGEEAR